MKLVVALALLAALLVSCGGNAPGGQSVTINARDESGQLIDPVNVWDNYQTRGAVVARVHDGDRVTLLRRDGNGVEIQTADGTQGWVTYTFIVGLKKQ